MCVALAVRTDRTPPAVIAKRGATHGNNDKRVFRVRVFVNQTWFDVDDVGKRSRVRDEEGMSDERREHRPAPEGRSARDTATE